MVSFAYEVDGVVNIKSFHPTSYDRMYHPKILSIGVPKPIKRDVDKTSFKIVETPVFKFDESLKYDGMGYSPDRKQLFFHFRNPE